MRRLKGPQTDAVESAQPAVAQDQPETTEEPTEPNGQTNQALQSNGEDGQVDTTLNDVAPASDVTKGPEEGQGIPNGTISETAEDGSATRQEQKTDAENATALPSTETEQLEAQNAEEQQAEAEAHEDEEEEEEEEDRPPHRMTTRARAQAETSDPASTASGTRPSSPSPSAAVVHPFFTAPPLCFADRDHGLPASLADETRQILCLYVQKQEEVCRSVCRLYDGLQRALRMRRDVWGWCRAEGHVGEMSDGEDWYDGEEWGLEEGLRKGEEVDDDEVTTTGKKTRHRRAAAQ